MSHTNANLSGLQFLAHNTRQAIFIYEVEANHFSYLNPAFEQAFNITKQSLVTPKALLNMVHPEDRQHVKETYQKLLKEKRCEGTEFRILLPDQEEKWVCLTSFLSGDVPGQQRVIGYMEDITSSKSYNDYLKKYGNKKNSVLHILAHDLAGPLAIIQSLSGALAEEIKSFGSPELDKLIGLIRKTSTQGSALIQNLISHEFLETTGVDLIKRRANIVTRFEEIMEQYREGEAELIKTFLFSSSSREIYIAFDDIKLMQAVNNLISNAIKFTKEGGVITVSLEEKEETVLIRVADNGIGIPKKYYSTLFDKFTTARRPGLHGEPTTGLGMSIIKTIVEWHNGQIWFDSEEGKGTTFYIELPKE